MRATFDVDAIVAVDGLPQFQRIEAEVAARGFSRDAESGVICRWKHRDSGVLFDLMPVDPGILGFSNPWYADAVRTALPVALEPGLEIRPVSAPAFVATKLVGSEGRQSEHQDILTRRLLAALRRLNPGLPEDAYAQVVEQIAQNRNKQIAVNANRELYRLLRDGVKVTVPDEHGGHGTEVTRVIDWTLPANNDFLLTLQMWVADDMYRRRCDLLACVQAHCVELLHAEQTYHRIWLLQGAFGDGDARVLPKRGDEGIGILFQPGVVAIGLQMLEERLDLRIRRRRRWWGHLTTKGGGHQNQGGQRNGTRISREQRN